VCRQSAATSTPPASARVAAIALRLQGHLCATLLQRVTAGVGSRVHPGDRSSTAAPYAPTLRPAPARCRILGSATEHDKVLSRIRDACTTPSHLLVLYRAPPYGARAVFNFRSDCAAVAVTLVAHRAQSSNPSVAIQGEGVCLPTRSNCCRQLLVALPFAINRAQSSQRLA